MYKLEVWARIEMIFYSKNIPKSGAIFCMGRCARVLRIFMIYLRFLGATKIGVALEHKFLNRVTERKMNIFLL